MYVVSFKRGYPVGCGAMWEKVQQQQGFEGVVVVAEGENVGPFLSNSLSCSEGWFWGNGVGVENPFFYSVLVGKVW